MKKLFIIYMRNIPSIMSFTQTRYLAASRSVHFLLCFWSQIWR